MLKLAILAMLPVAGSCASFSCQGTSSREERLVCDDKQLSALDYRLEGIYSLALSLDAPAEVLRSDQRTWLAVSRAKCSDTQCLSVAYRDRIHILMRLIQRVAEPLPAELSAKVVHAVTKSAYCKANGADSGDEFSLVLTIKGSAVAGSIDGFFDCGRKVWGPIDVHGDKIDNVALLRFEAGWLESSPMAAEALVVVGRGQHVYWRVLSEVNVESYVPISEQLRRAR